jgi:integrase
VKLLEGLRPGDRVQDVEIGGLYAECGARGVSLKLAVDVARGKTVRRTLAQWRPGAVALDLRGVRADAARIRAEIRAGQVPAPTARRAPKADVAGELTVAQAVDRYIEDMTQRGCAEKTIRFTGARLRTHLADWLARPLAGVKPSDCQAEHKRITAGAGDVAANKVLRDFRALWNLAVKQSDQPERFPPKCPVASVTMNAELATRQNAVITDLPGWWRRVGDLGNGVRRAMFRLGLLSGLRPRNLCGIRREWIDLTPGREVIRFPAAVMKGRAGKRRAFSLPLSRAMVGLVREALELGPKLVRVAPERCEWLFPTNSRDGKSVVTTSNWTEPTLEPNECGHALRHTYRTLSADAGVPFDVGEMLVAHTLPGVGARYVHAGELDARLRAAQEQVSAFILARVAAA